MIRDNLRPLLSKAGDGAALVLGTGFGFGLSPVLPGTVGSLWGLPLVWGIDQYHWPLGLRLLLCVLLFIVGVPICARAARLIGQGDPGQVVFDEVAAMAVVFLAVPVTATSLVAGFVWFRIFDITKPWPARRFDRWHGGLGIMADDTAAALYAAAALWLTVEGLSAAGWGGVH